MPVTREQAHVLGALAAAIRSETNGAGDWDVAGVVAQLETVRGMSLAEVARAVTRLAEDSTVKTPGGLRDMKNPCWRERVVGATVPRNPTRDEACDICSRTQGQLHDGHEWQPVRNLSAADTSERVHQLKALARGDAL